MSYDHIDKRITNRALHDEGFLFEANRRFFHPLGLELRASPPYLEESSLEVADLREVEGGPVFEWDTEGGVEHANECRNNVDRQLKLRRFTREEKLRRGDVVQPIPPGFTPEPDEPVWSDRPVEYRYMSVDDAVEIIRSVVEREVHQEIDERRIEEYTEMLTPPVVESYWFDGDLYRHTFTSEDGELAEFFGIDINHYRPIRPVAGSVPDPEPQDDWLEVRHDGPV